MSRDLIALVPFGHVARLDLDERLGHEARGVLEPFEVRHPVVLLAHRLAVLPLAVLVGTRECAGAVLVPVGDVVVGVEVSGAAPS